MNKTIALRKNVETGFLTSYLLLVNTKLQYNIFQMYYSYAKIKDRVRTREKTEHEEQKKKEQPVKLPRMKTFHHFDSLESTFIGFSRDTTYDNDAFAPSRADSGVFDNENKEYVERKDRPRGAVRDKPSRKDYEYEFV